MIGTYDADHPLIQRPDTVLAWVKPTSIDYEAAATEVGKLVYVQLNDIGYLEAGRRVVDVALGIVEETT